MPAATLPVNEIFETIQGEGFYTGVPSVFVRLQGCDVGCAWCDTKHTWELDEQLLVSSAEVNQVSAEQGNWANYPVEQLLKQIQSYHAKHVVITGGEPCIYDLLALTESLEQQGCTVQIETSGTYPVKASNATWVTVSPKVNMKGKKTVLVEALQRADEIKHPVARESDIENLHALLAQVEGGADKQIALQPVSQGKRATELCIQTCIEQNWRLSMQTHKYLGID